MSVHETDSKPRRLAVASNNTGKLHELAELLADHDIAVLGQAELGLASIAETGLTFVENALLKARHLATELTARQQTMPVLADDSGLVVPALDGAPGLYSARYSGAAGSDADNNHLLLQNMQTLQGEQRRAWFHCSLVCLHHAEDPDPLLAIARWHGHIATRPEGEHGFGYDPLFVPQGGSVSAAGMDPADKRRASHRGQALQQLLAMLPAWW